MKINKQNILNIPSNLPFLDALSFFILQEKDLSSDLIILPTNRSCRKLKLKLTELNKQDTFFMPKIISFSEFDEDDIFFNSDNPDFDNQIPSISPISRASILSKFIKMKDDNTPWDQAFSLAFELGKLIDSFNIEQIDFNKIYDIIPETKHYENVEVLLKIIKENWHNILKEENKIDPSNFAIEQTKKYANFLQNCKEYKRIIIAGTTGSQPATRHLIKKILTKENGFLILPGLDTNIDKITSETLEQNHPQYGLQFLINELGIIPQDIKTICQQKNLEEFLNKKLNNKNICDFMHLLMQSYQKDTGKYNISKNDISNINLIDCENDELHAMTSAIIAKNEFEKNNKNEIIIVSTDQINTKRIEQNLKKFGLNADLSSGQSFNNTAEARYFLSLVKLIENDFSPVAILSIIKNKFFTINQNTIQAQDFITKYALEGSRPEGGIQGFINKINQTETKEIESKQQALEILNFLNKKSENLTKSKTNTFENFLQIHTEFLISSSNTDNDIFQNLIKNLNEVKNQLSNFDEELTIHEYYNILENLLKSSKVRLPQKPNSIQILGPMEARMLCPDVLILSGLTEGSFPQNLPEDIWLNSKMRSDLGLPLPIRKIGLSSHDFVQLISPCKKVFLTKSNNSGNKPTTTSRWWLKLEALTKLLKINLDKTEKTIINAILEEITSNKNVEKILPPAPNPDIKFRPKKLSATNFETLLINPYAIYAKYILKLRQTNEIDQEMSYAEFGNYSHKALENFFIKKMSTQTELVDEFSRIIESENIQNFNKPFWIEKFSSFAKFFIKDYINKKHLLKDIIIENEISTELNDFKIFATADRIDIYNDDSAEIIDYKTGTPPRLNEITNGKKPQMIIEAFILSSGFAQSKTKAYEITLNKIKEIKVLSFYSMNKNRTSFGEKTTLSKDISTHTEIAKQNLDFLIKTYFQKKTPFIYSTNNLSESDEQRYKEFDPYYHLSRKDEWN